MHSGASDAVPVISSSSSALECAVLAFGAAASLPAKVPLQLTTSRFVFTFVGILVAAVLGSALSLRRVLRIDPASAIGGGS